MSITNLPYNGEMNFRAKELRREMTQHGGNYGIYFSENIR